MRLEYGRQVRIPTATRLQLHKEGRHRRYKVRYVLSRPASRCLVWHTLAQATGKVGSQIVEHLLANGIHEVIAITRKDSSAATPEGVKVARVDDSEPAHLSTLCMDSVP